ncbi:hypothetical protein [Mycolicibacterium xanthum]|nr:hypothetical protein [Mycolicibacterium xanthum]
MTRLPEVVEYASRHLISVEAAIICLVNHGLSHQSVSYLPSK